MFGEHDYIDKRWMYEESIRMPFFVRYPKKIKPGSRTDAIINNADFAPTMIELASGATPEYMQGKSFKSILETGIEPDDWQKGTYYRYWMHLAHKHQNPAQFGICTKDYKLIFYRKCWADADNPDLEWDKTDWGIDYANHTPAAWEFYDLKKDPNKMNNEYNNLEYKDIISDLKTQPIRMSENLNETDAKYLHVQKVIDKRWNDY